MRVHIQPRAIQVLTITLSLMSTLALGQTFSPYTPEQIQEFNSQPISPAESPLGPVYPSMVPIAQGKKLPLGAGYIKNPEGEEQAEAQGEESDAPFEPIPATFSF